MPNHRFDQWARHPARFYPDALERAVDAISLPVGGLVVDPFVGVGTAATFITGRGDRFYGLEANPIMGQVAALKLARPGAAEDLRDAVDALVGVVKGMNRSPVDQEPDVLRRFLSEDRLADLVAFREAADVSGSAWTQHLRWLVIAAMRDSVGSGWPYATAGRRSRGAAQSVAALIHSRANTMADDLAAAPRAPTGHVACVDARDPSSWRDLAAASVDACVSSPPYMNQVSYAEVTRLELAFTRIASSWDQITAQVSRHLVASSTQQVTVAGSQRAQRDLAELPGIHANIEALALRLERAKSERARGKRYDLLVYSYFADIGRVLTHLRRVLVPGGRVAWILGDSAPYGVYVDTPALIAVLATDQGFEVLDDIVLRERPTKWSSAPNRHARQLTERLLLLRRPLWGSQESLPGLG